MIRKKFRTPGTRAEEEIVENFFMETGERISQFFCQSDPQKIILDGSLNLNLPGSFFSGRKNFSPILSKFFSRLFKELCAILSMKLKKLQQFLIYIFSGELPAKFFSKSPGKPVKNAAKIPQKRGRIRPEIPRKSAGFSEKSDSKNRFIKTSLFD